MNLYLILFILYMNFFNNFIIRIFIFDFSNKIIYQGGIGHWIRVKRKLFPSEIGFHNPSIKYVSELKFIKLTKKNLNRQ